ncbi:hypothetical protein GN244_ATG14890 [Phytophthora infestans]|uniref:Uncharacterized protein n=1 Tax=Phytophthora infestans TaxID=4787 RepID=A0A833SMS9_PHYIN|nr:hypothetical protein GN244_ATG14890 [Phytophthora infestans]KAF4137726.1 hypothetical protein GN958_ATG13127 [Phytophthora infestans]KAF4142890.1 hypothetical protein GN958_ATG07876 [Phytophthora infestans]
MVRLQCLVSLEEEVRVVSIDVSLQERIDKLQARLEEELDVQATPNNVMKLFCVQHQRLTYRQGPTTKFEVFFLDGDDISGADACSAAVLQGAKQLVPWASVSWYFQDLQFSFPDAIDVVVIWEHESENLEDFPA